MSHSQYLFKYLSIPYMARSIRKDDPLLTSSLPKLFRPRHFHFNHFLLGIYSTTKLFIIWRPIIQILISIMLWKLSCGCYQD
jgi:hypothetical protein